MARDVGGEIEQVVFETGDVADAPASDERSPRVLVVSPVRLFREGIGLVLRTRGLRRVVVSSDLTVLEAIRDAAADVVILDVTRPSMFPIMRDVATRYAHVRLLALGVGESDGDVLACAEAGAAGYISVEMGADELLVAIENARRDELVCSPRIAALLFRRHAARSARPASGDSRLTRREQEVLTLVDDGLSNKEIAARLHISPTTVKNHVHRILEKLQVRRRGAAAASLHDSATRPVAPYSR